MGRYYTEIEKDEFLEKVKSLMPTHEELEELEEAGKVVDYEEFPYNLGEQKGTKDIAKDIAKVDFNFENYTAFGDTTGGSTYPVGHMELKPKFHVYFVVAGGDWEFPICFILYWGNNNKMRAYIPKDGNAWNKKEKTAYGSEHTEENEKTDEEIEKEVNESKIIAEILKHITLKK